ncbi:hypothetical protein R3W88_001554 [Solanum pinnatisectum]|uniref:Uncharacterized protein n=1 Tax=Solanum pinnatisectum TaxID=50273 RepID=A0AAV9MIH4_9SOLN|nr:hypothetical protein R3W88_001554 [Solanum pinnatisectum]
MNENETVIEESFDKDLSDDETTIDGISPFESNSDEDNAHGMTWSEREIRKIIKHIENKVMELEAKRSQIDAKSSAAANKITADIELLLCDRDLLKEGLDEFLVAFAEQQREDALKEDMEMKTHKKRKYDLAGTSASSEFTQEHWKDMLNQHSDSSEEEEMEMQRRNAEQKSWRDDESRVRRMHLRIEAAFNNSCSDSDDPSQDQKRRNDDAIEIAATETVETAQAIEEKTRLTVGELSQLFRMGATKN